MVELPSNWRQHIGDNFFSRLARPYEERGTRIICGDRRIKYLLDIHESKPWEAFLGLIYDLSPFSHTRDEAMSEAIREERPQVVVVGGSHANYLKREFPDSYYTALRTIGFLDPFEYVALKFAYIPKNADEVINLF